MTISENTLGIGRLATVAWTPLEGTGLDARELNVVDQQVDAARQVADALLAAAKGAFNLGWTSFRLDDLQALGQLGTLATGDATADEWAAFIGSSLGIELSAGDGNSFNGWRRIADEMQRYAALQASRRNPAGGADGDAGVTHANGQWYANGQALSLMDLFTAVRVNRLVTYDESIDGDIQDLQENQRRLNAAREWGSMLRAGKPRDADSTGMVTSGMTNEFIAKWGIDPVGTFTPSLSGQLNTNVKGTQFDIWLNQLKAFIDKTDSSNQIIQSQIDQKSKRRSEVTDAMTSFAGKESKTGSLMASNLA